MKDDREKALTEEIEAALMGAAPSEDEKAEWAREALEQAERMPAPKKTPRGRGFLLGLAAAAAILIVAGLFLGPDPREPEAPTPPEIAAPEADPREEYEAARRINEAALRKPEIREKLAAATKGSWAAVAGGRLIAIADTAKALLEKTKNTEVRSAQWFIWEIGTEGDITCETTFPYEMVVGNAFLAACDLSFSMGPDGAAFWTGGRPPKVEELKRYPSHDGRVYIPLQFMYPPGFESAGRPITLPPKFLVATGYSGPMILPEPTPTLLCFDTPGLATVNGMGGSRIYRRFTTRVRNLDLGLDRMVEALGDLQTPTPPAQIRGLSWPRHGSERLEAARDSRRPLALLAWDPGKSVSLAPLTAPGVVERLRACERAMHSASWTDPLGLAGAPFASPAELAVYLREGGEGRDMALVGRVKLTDDAAGAVEALLTRALGRTEYDVHVLRPADPLDEDMRARVLATLESRLRSSKVAVSVSENRVELKVPWNSTLTKEAILRRATRTGKLEFRILAEDGDPTERGPLDLAAESAARTKDPRAHAPPASPDRDHPGYAWYRWQDDAEDGSQRWALARLDRWNFGSADLERVGVSRNHGPPHIDWIVNFGILDTREKDFGLLTGPNSAEDLGEGRGRKLAIILDGRITMAPTLRSKLTDGGYIEGNFSREEAEDLAAVLRSGALPVRLVPMKR